jgi:hypothetical protein
VQKIAIFDKVQKIAIISAIFILWEDAQKKNPLRGIYLCHLFLTKSFISVYSHRFLHVIFPFDFHANHPFFDNLLKFRFKILVPDNIEQMDKKD